MIRETLFQLDQNTTTLAEDCPLTVREAATYLGVRPQTVYLWVERGFNWHTRG
jgi:hypothetical protein